MVAMMPSTMECASVITLIQATGAPHIFVFYCSSNNCHYPGPASVPMADKFRNKFWNDLNSFDFLTQGIILCMDT